MDLALSYVSYSATYMYFVFPDMPYTIFDALCVVAPMIGYIDQLCRIYYSKCSTNFQTGPSLVQFFSNYLRILYWFGNNFASYLLWQSIFTIIVHISLCFMYFRYLELPPQRRPSAANPLPKIPAFFTLHPFKVYTFLEFFFSLFAYFLGIAILAAVLALFVPITIVAEILGLISNLMDSMTTLPVFITIVVHKNISYTTNILIMQYISGSVLKIVLFFFRPTPWPFRVGAVLQSALVSIISIQYLIIKLRQKRLLESEEEEEEEEYSTKNLKIEVYSSDEEYSE